MRDVSEGLFKLKSLLCNWLELTLQCITILHFSVPNSAFFIWVHLLSLRALPNKPFVHRSPSQSLFPEKPNLPTRASLGFKVHRVVQIINAIWISKREKPLHFCIIEYISISPSLQNVCYMVSPIDFCDMSDLCTQESWLDVDRQEGE